LCPDDSTAPDQIVGAENQTRNQTNGHDGRVFGVDEVA
jgi:hypothetical protein